MESVKCITQSEIHPFKLGHHKTTFRQILQLFRLMLSLAGANEHRISPTLADRVPTYVDFINTPQNETI